MSLCHSAFCEQGVGVMHFLISFKFILAAAITFLFWKHACGIISIIISAIVKLHISTQQEKKRGSGEKLHYPFRIIPRYNINVTQDRALKWILIL